MTSPPLIGERWERIQNLLNDALECAPELQAEFLQEACGGDDLLRREVESLLEAHSRPGLVDELSTSVVAPLIARLEPPRSLEGQTVSHYQVLGKLSGGGMGVVYRAQDTVLSRSVALKFPLPHLRSDEAARQLFVREARTAAAIDHPNICTIHEIGETADGDLFIAMALYEGETLDTRLSRGPLAIREALELAVQAGCGLAKAHERGVVHRDIKPANLLITQDGILKIVDFGIAVLIDAAQVGVGAAVGTINYMSPEQCDGGLVDARADIWSLGVVLYEMVTGVLPFRRPDRRSTLRAIREMTPAPMSSLRTGVTEGLDAIISRAIAKDPDERHASVQALISELTALVALVDEPADGNSNGAPAFSLAPTLSPTLASTLSPTEPAGGAEVSAEGERRYVTVSVSRIVGYANLREELTEGDADRVDRRLASMAEETARRHGGVLNSCAEGVIVMLFGAPTAQENDPIRCVSASLELRERLPELGMGTDPIANVTWQLQCGVAAGLLVVTPPADGGGPYDLAGDTLSVASALSDGAAADEIWVSPKVQRLVEPEFATEPRDPVPLTGRRQVAARCIIRDSGLRTHLDGLVATGLAATGMSATGLSTLAGRERELRILEQHATDALGGDGSFLTIEGEAGLGKSRLLIELRRLIEPRAMTILSGRCQSFGTRSPYLPFIDVLRQHLLAMEEIRDGEVPDAVERIRRRLDGIEPKLIEFLPLYLHLLDIQSEDHPLPAHAPTEHFGILLVEALAGFVTSLARQQPVALLMEDWHWVDEASLAVSRQLAEMVAQHPLLFVVTHRPDPRLSWAPTDAHERLRLEPLEASASLDIIKSILNVSQVPAELLKTVHERAGGNPFFVEEICRAVAQGGPWSLPDTVEVVIRARIDRVSRKEREVLRAASVIGREFTRSILGQTIGDNEGLIPSLQKLQVLGLIQQTRIVPEATFRFKHALTHEVAYETLVSSQRKTLHDRAGRAIEDGNPQGADKQADLLVHHFRLAEEWPRAICYALTSAARAQALSRLPEALHMLERARSWIEKLSEEKEVHAQVHALEMEILLKLERICETLGHRDRQQELINELVSGLHPERDEVQLAEVWLRQGDFYLLSGRYDEAERSLARSLALLERLHDLAGQAKTMRSFFLLHRFQGRGPEAIAAGERALHIDRERGDKASLVLDLSTFGNMLVESGRVDRVPEHLAEAEALLEDLEDPGSRAHLLQLIYVLRTGLGDDEGAISALDDAILLAESHRLYALRPYLLT